MLIKCMILFAIVEISIIQVGNFLNSKSTIC
jgi:hypothetical protein